jgi:hypothetical protein
LPELLCSLALQALLLPDAQLALGREALRPRGIPRAHQAPDLVVHPGDLLHSGIGYARVR